MGPAILLLLVGAGIYALSGSTATDKPPAKPPKNTPGKAPPKVETPQESPPKVEPPKVQPTDEEPPDYDGGNDLTVRLVEGDMGTYRIAQSDALIVWGEVDVDRIFGVDSSNAAISESVTTVNHPSVFAIEPEATGMTSISVDWERKGTRVKSTFALEVTE